MQTFNKDRTEMTERTNLNTGNRIGATPEMVEVKHETFKAAVKGSLRHLDHEATETEEDFIKFWNQTLHATRWMEYLISWSRALGAYNIPASMVNDSTFGSVTLMTTHGPWNVASRDGEIYSKRLELMKTQKPYSPVNSSYPHNLELSACPLCENVAQSIDAEGSKSRKDPAIVSLDNYILLPNRYPSVPGAALFLAKDHDESSTRVTMQMVEGRKTYLPEPGKTRGNLLSQMDLYAMILIADSFNLLAKRNHPLSGMSLPLHDHTHMYPEDLPIGEHLTPHLVNSPVLSVEPVPNIPFSTLRISSPNPRELAAVAAEIIKNLEIDDQIFGLIYTKGNLFICPRISNDHRQIFIGGGSPFLEEELSKIDNVTQVFNRNLPAADEYNWSRYARLTDTHFSLAVN